MEKENDCLTQVLQKLLYNLKLPIKYVKRKEISYIILKCPVNMKHKNKTKNF